MFKKLIGLVMATVLLAFGLIIGSAAAVELSEATRTVPLNDQGDTVVLSLKQVQEGKRLLTTLVLSVMLAALPRQTRM